MAKKTDDQRREYLLQLIQEIEADHHEEGVDEITSVALEQIRTLPDYQQYTHLMEFWGIQATIWRMRGARNSRIKKAVYEDDKEYFRKRSIPKITPLDNSVRKTAQKTKQQYDELYEKTIAGRTLGQLTFNEVQFIAIDCQNMAEGHLYNSRVMTLLSNYGKRRKINPSTTIREGIPGAELMKIFKRAERKKDKTA